MKWATCVCTCPRAAPSTRGSWGHSCGWAWPWRGTGTCIRTRDCTRVTWHVSPPGGVPAEGVVLQHGGETLRLRGFYPQAGEGGEAGQDTCHMLSLYTCHTTHYNHTRVTWSCWCPPPCPRERGAAPGARRGWWWPAGAASAPSARRRAGSCTYRVSHNWVFTLFWLFSRLPELVQRSILPFFNSPGDVDSKTHLTFLLTSKIDQVTAQNVRQTGFWKCNFDGRF